MRRRTNIIRKLNTNGIRKNGVVSLVAIAVLILLVVCIMLTGCSVIGDAPKGDPIDINKYIIPEVSGYDGYGSVSFGIDYRRLINETKGIDQAKYDVLDLIDEIVPFTAKYQRSDTLSNGDIVVVEWDRNEEDIKKVENTLGIKIAHENYKYSVNGLKGLTDYNPFDNLCIDAHNTSSGNGKIDFAINAMVGKQEINWKVTHSGKDGTIKNGDVLTLAIVDDIDKDAFARTTGLRITSTTCEYEVVCLADYAIDSTILYHVDSTEVVFGKVVENWVVSGLNDEGVMASQRTYKPYGYMLYTNATPNAESMLVAIYKIDDRYVVDGYYVFIGLKGVLSFDNNSVYCNNEELPTSFMAYEKETIRYSEKFGWRQGDESMGFLYNDIAYAGHRNIEETLGYLATTYGADFSYLYVSESLKDAVTERKEGD